MSEIPYLQVSLQHDPPYLGTPYFIDHHLSELIFAEQLKYYPLHVPAYSWMQGKSGGQSVLSMSEPGCVIHVRTRLCYPCQNQSVLSMTEPGCVIHNQAVLSMSEPGCVIHAGAVGCVIHVRTRLCYPCQNQAVLSMLELNRGEQRMSAFECVRRVYRSDGLRGFYRGMSASYAGISETVIHFVIYESIKRRLVEAKATANMDDEDESVKDASDFAGMMLAAATSKTCATSIAYPHGEPGVGWVRGQGSGVRGRQKELWQEVCVGRPCCEVIRTRLREEGTKYRSFFQTLSMVIKEEGYRALYRGLTTHLVRQIPNTAIMMCTYELVVYLLNGDLHPETKGNTADQEHTHSPCAPALRGRGQETLAESQGGERESGDEIGAVSELRILKNRSAESRV
ncbi:hypothetical protein JZ751_027120 [Albula glossodonta]|uniref:Mitochondrial carrier protein n=1 Tax=Albula glossodonta TaxID=121402 RepID=A0A8T2MSJ4_9TELE|nr:hypothetical protein JZ751_027120 [Albula glossodonta]